MTRLRGPGIAPGVAVHPSDEPQRITGDRVGVRDSIAAHEYPRMLFWAGVLLVVFTTLTFFAEPTAGGQSHLWSIHILDVLVASALIVVSTVMSRGGIPPVAMPWVFSTAATVTCLVMLYELTIDPAPQYFTYVAIILCAFGPSSLAWRPFLAGAVIILAGALGVTLTWPIGSTMDWMLTAAAAAVVGGFLLRFRLRSINALADTTALARRLATVDQLTGVLNRHGLMEHITGLWAMAARLEEPLFVVFVDIRGLKQANDRLGHEFGDKVIQAAARAVTKSVRGGDLVARWGGDELLVVGIGRISDGEAFNARLQGQSEWAGADREMWAGDLSVGYAEGLPALVSVDDLIRQADEDMYRRRMTG